MKKVFDFIVVGAGSAGSVVANRLSTQTNLSVALLEAGPSNNSEYINTPLGIALLIPRQLPVVKQYSWGYQSQPEQFLKGKKVWSIRGKTLGGSSSINAMIYIRGNKGDYDIWQALGNDGWGYKDVLKYFIKSEHNERIKNEFHGQNGPLNVKDVSWKSPIYDLIIQSLQSQNLPLNDDFNGQQQLGCGGYQLTQKNGQRCSAANAFLDPLHSQKNLTILTNHHVNKIRMDGKRAVGLDVTNDGKQYQFEAAKEIILCGGAFNSPQILLLSGIGGKKELQDHGIEQLIDLPGVGQNLQDHPDILLKARVNVGIDYCLDLRNIMKQYKGFQDYRKNKLGFLCSQGNESGAYLKINQNEEYPDIQMHVTPALMNDHGRKPSFGNGISVHSNLCRPESRGYVGLVDKNPQTPPKIVYNFMQSLKDRELMTNAILWTNKFLRNSPLKNIITDHLVVKDDNPSKSMLEDLLTVTDTVYHPTSTCKMGNDSMAAVDNHLKVHGVEGLRIADASIMPNIVGGNTNAPCIMIGEKVSDMILQQLYSQQ